MIVKATALHNLQFTSNGQIVNIRKGDVFNLTGNVFAYKGLLIDISEHADMFDIKYQHAQPAGLRVRAKHAIQLDAANNIVIPAGKVFDVASDIILVSNTVLLDLAKWRDSFECLGSASAEQSEPAELAEPAESSEPAEPAEQAEQTETAELAEQSEPAEPAESSEPANLANPTNVKFADGILSWSPVDGAATYDIYVNGKCTGNVTGNAADMSSILSAPGKYLVGVVAINGDRHSLATDIKVTVLLNAADFSTTM